MVLWIFLALHCCGCRTIVAALAIMMESAIANDQEAVMNSKIMMMENNNQDNMRAGNKKQMAASLTITTNVLPP